MVERIIPWIIISWIVKILLPRGRRSFLTIRAVRAAVLSTVPGLPVRITKDALAIYRFPLLAGAVAKDLLTKIDAVPRVLMDLRDGSLNSSSAFMVRILSFTYEHELTESAANLAHTLLGNQTVRVAIVLYARANGNPIAEADLDQLRNIFNTEDPDLGPVVVAG